MKIETLMSRPARTCAPTDSLNIAAHLMWDGDLGAVPVVDDQRRLLGVVTDRDVCMAAHLQGSRLDEIPVGEVMARRVHALRPGQPINDALQLMRREQVRRVPVVDDQRRLVGVLSLADLARAWSLHLEADGRQLRADDVADTLAAVCRARADAPSGVLTIELETPAEAPPPATPKGRKGRAARTSKAAKGAKPRAKAARPSDPSGPSEPLQA